MTDTETQKEKRGILSWEPHQLARTSLILALLVFGIYMLIGLVLWSSSDFTVNVFLVLIFIFAVPGFVMGVIAFFKIVFSPYKYKGIISATVGVLINGFFAGLLIFACIVGCIWCYNLIRDAIPSKLEGRLDTLVSTMRGSFDSYDPNQDGVQTLDSILNEVENYSVGIGNLLDFIKKERIADANELRPVKSSRIVGYPYRFPSSEQMSIRIKKVCYAIFLDPSKKSIGRLQYRLREDISYKIRGHEGGRKLWYKICDSYGSDESSKLDHALEDYARCSVSVAVATKSIELIEEMMKKDAYKDSKQYEGLIKYFSELLEFETGEQNRNEQILQKYKELLEQDRQSAIPLNDGSVRYVLPEEVGKLKWKVKEIKEQSGMED